MFTRSRGTAEGTGRVCRNKQSLLRDVVQRAQELGTWIDVDDIIGKMIGNGQEYTPILYKINVNKMKK